MLDPEVSAAEPNAYRPALERPGAPGAAAFPDAQLLAAYRSSRSADLFAQIYARHGAMVYRTGYRVSANRQDAEDVVQAVFALLAQRPGLVKHNLGGWLYEAARNTALNLQRSRARRACRERAAARGTRGATPPRNQELREELDAALCRLEPALREAVVLRYLEGHSQEDAARLAGCPRGTLSRRAAEGLACLRAILAQRGLAVPRLVLLGFLGRELARDSAASAAPPALSAALCQAAATARTAGQALGWAKAAVWLAALAVAGAVALGVAALRTPAPAPAPPPPPVQSGDGRDRPFAACDLGRPRDADVKLYTKRPQITGSYFLEGGTLTVKSSGLDLWNTHDSCYFVHQKLDGDGEISARLVSAAKTGQYPKVGVMLRQALDADAANAFLGQNWSDEGKNLVFQVRPTPGAETEVLYAGKRLRPVWFKLVRRGGTVTALASEDGRSYAEVGSQQLGWRGPLYAGVAATSHQDGVLNTSVFDHVRVTAGR